MFGKMRIRRFMFGRVCDFLIARQNMDRGVPLLYLKYCTGRLGYSRLSLITSILYQK
jgi:hypothetical protein